MSATRKTHIRSKTEGYDADQRLFKRHRVVISNGSMKIVTHDTEIPNVKSALNRGRSFNVEQEEDAPKGCFGFLKRR